MKENNFFKSSLPLCVLYTALFVAQLSLHSCSSRSNEQIKANASDTTGVKSSATKPITPEEKLLNLEIERAFWKNRLQLAQDETLDLMVDLIDSTMILEIRGVPVRECKILKYYIGKNLSELKTNQDVLKWLSYPFEIENEWSNIPKEPIKIREINTKDSTTESILDLYREKLPDIQVVFSLSRGLAIYIDHIDDQFPSDTSIFNLMNKQLVKKVKYLVKIKINVSDIKAIYRSLSENSGLSFRY